MDVDWEVEIGGGAPMIETDWPGFVDLYVDPDRISEIAEAVSFPPLAHLLIVINGAGSQLWTSKCDFWRPEPFTSASYVDVLPRATSVFTDWRDAEKFCRACVSRMNEVRPEVAKESISLNGQNCSLSKEEPEISINLVIRTAISKDQEGFGITVYLSAKGSSADDSSAALAYAMDIVADALLDGSTPQGLPSTLE